MSPNNITQGHFVKIKWMVTFVAAERSPDRAERANLGVIRGFWLDVSLTVQVVFVVREPLCNVETPS